MLKKYNIFCLIFFILVVLLSSCSRRTDQPLKINICVWPGYDSLYLASELKFFDDSVAVLDEALTSEDTIKQFSSSVCDIAALTMDEVVQLKQLNKDFKIIAIMDISNGGDMIISQPIFKNIKELKGKRIAVQTTTTGDYFLALALNSVGIQTNEVNIIFMPTNEVLEDFKSNNIDAVVTYFPYNIDIEKAGGLNIFDSSKTPDKILEVLVIRTELLQSRREDVIKVLDGMFKAVTLINNRDEKALNIISKREEVTIEELSESLNGIIIPGRDENIQLFSGNPSKFNMVSKDILDFMAANKLCSKDISLNDSVDTSIIFNIK